MDKGEVEGFEVEGKWNPSTSKWKEFRLPSTSKMPEVQ